MNVTVKTFAQLREITQEGSFTLTLPDSTVTMGDVITLLKSRSEKWAQALGASAGSENGSVLMARNQQLCDIQTHVQPDDELAFFPPVTGG
ncbi:MoaD/ThiS family protein [Alteromonas stellipolaris]|jgi:molybdopterin synthase sulfur carrier subunit|uniref:MoaD/ThiS family protein n=1 Tax=Alteromonas stellipolaris TaxID=233316 RepID=UPI0021194D1F|nr:MoaD/ThiS family protein [Alteromonas stellipolaris]MCQ8850169.1 MoaD/ThiS family protein [Alteromonas stellipolaris]MDP2538001.1 MoaD/ThiS family protein [Alteromonas stellipolaris]